VNVRRPQILAAVLDLDAAANARRFGTAGLDRMWTQLDEDTTGLELPMYGGRFMPAPKR
jgi:hypothetical protein